MINRITLECSFEYINIHFNADTNELNGKNQPQKSD